MKRLNFRPILFLAVGLAFGISLCYSILLEKLRATDFVFCTLFCVLCIRFPFRWKQFAVGALVFLFSVGVGFLSAYQTYRDYEMGHATAHYEVVARVESVSDEGGYQSVLLSQLNLNGGEAEGNMRAQIEGEGIRSGDFIKFKANITRLKLDGTQDSLYYFTKDIRYQAYVTEFTLCGRSENVFLRLNATLYETLYDGLEGETADVAYVLLTGSSGNLDDTFSEATQRGGIAHIFAVSGLHIGILFSAIFFLCKPLGKWRVLPATVVAILYSGLCGFTVSSLRAVIMCTVGGVFHAFGEKKDFLETISLASILVLLLFPAEWLSAGFRLSFGACLGLALFSGSFQRTFTAWKFPRFLASYLSSVIAVQLFTLPTMFEFFGYFSLWGMVLNFFVIPALPAVFLSLVLCTLFSLLIPMWSGVFLALPSATIGALAYLFSLFDFSAVLCGFSLGAGGTVWLVACVGLSEKVRMEKGMRAIVAILFVCLFIVCVLLRNVPFATKVQTHQTESGTCVLVRTGKENVLVIDGEISLSACEDFLMRNYAGELDGVVYLDANKNASVAPFLKTAGIYTAEEGEWGIMNTPVNVCENFSIGELEFTYFSPERLLMRTENCTVEICFTQESALSSDFFVGNGCGDLIFYCGSDTIYLVSEN